MDRILTPQQHCLLLFFLKLPVDQATSKFHHCVSDVDILGYQFSSKKRPIRDITTKLDTGLHLKMKRPIRDLTAELESRSDMVPLDILS